jgi:heme exporter protein C
LNKYYRSKIKLAVFKLRNILHITTFVMMLVVLYAIFLWVPTDKNLGISQRIFYIHVPLAWSGFLAFVLVLIGSVGYLWKRTPKWDHLAHASAEVGVLFTTLMLTTGVLWAKPVWGVWWTWDPRLTTSLILWLIYVAYLMLRAYSSDRYQAERSSAILGIFGFIDVPIVYLSIYWWRTVHPQPLVGPATSGGLDSSMYNVLMLSTLVFTLILVCLVLERISIFKSERSLEEIRWSLELSK